MSCNVEMPQTESEEFGNFYLFLLKELRSFLLEHQSSATNISSKNEEDTSCTGETENKGEDCDRKDVKDVGAEVEDVVIRSLSTCPAGGA